MAPIEGMPALTPLRRGGRALGRRRSTDWQWCARFGYQVIERRGTGGGNFRLMYSRFLAEAGYDGESALAAEASARWTDLAAALQSASEDDEPDPAVWARVDEDAAAVLEAEERLWDALASTSAA